MTSAGGGFSFGAITVLIVWVCSLNGIEIPGEVAAALTAIIGYLGGLLGGWLVKPGTGTRRA